MKSYTILLFISMTIGLMSQDVRNPKSVIDINDPILAKNTKSA